MKKFYIKPKAISTNFEDIIMVSAVELEKGGVINGHDFKDSSKFNGALFID